MLILRFLARRWEFRHHSFDKAIAVLQNGLEVKRGTSKSSWDKC